MYFSTLFRKMSADSYWSHPASVCMTYFQHFCFSMMLCRKFAIGSMKAFVHAVYPAVYITSSSDLIEDVKEDMKKVGCRKDATSDIIPSPH